MAVLVPVMQVGNVRVGVGQLGMVMFVGVPQVGRFTRVAVSVVTVIMSMAVSVGLGLVLVPMLVVCAQQQPECGDQDSDGDQLRGHHGFPQNGPSQDTAEEGRRGEEHLGAGQAVCRRY